MSSRPSIQRSTKSRNQAGCPYLNQTGADAVLDWVSVLAGIDPAALPSELQSELRQLKLQSSTPFPAPAPRRSAPPADRPRA
jgi:hypothetical protein